MLHLGEIIKFSYLKFEVLTEWEGLDASRSASTATSQKQNIYQTSTEVRFWTLIDKDSKVEFVLLDKLWHLWHFKVDTVHKLQ